MDLVIIRENEEDLYAGIEHQQTDEVIQCLKLISRPGCEKIVRYAFEYAKVNGRKKVTCMSKDNIMKQTDGMFHTIFNEIGLEYPEIEKDHWIIDIGSARIADTPEVFDVIVTLNLYGDIISDIAAQIAGSVGLAGSSNIGDGFAMFEAIHGSAPTIAGQGIANPSGLIQGAVLMLLHIGETESAEMIQNAWLKTLEDGIHTADIYKAEVSSKKVGTNEFAQAVIERLGQEPQQLKAVKYKKTAGIQIKPYQKRVEAKKELIGVDIFICWNGTNANEIGEKIAPLTHKNIELSMISNRGIKVWPNGFDETFCTDHWRCRYKSLDGSTISQGDIIALLTLFNQHQIEVIKTENLYTFDGKIGFSLGQGQ
jgi:isocitrate dehydrogenase